MSRHLIRGLSLAAAGLAGVAAFSAAAPARSSATPSPMAEPIVSGTLTAGHTLKTTNGFWNNNPTSYQYQWARCDRAGRGCAAINGATRQNYRLTGDDAGHRVQVTVNACNSSGCAANRSNAVGPIKANAAPTNTAAPSVTGSAVAGGTVTANEGAWANAPTSFAYQWLRCDASGNNCGSIGGATARAYVATVDDVGATLRVRVAARNDRGAGSATSTQSAVVATGTGGSAVPVSAVNLPNQLVVSSVEFAPTVVRSRGPFDARFKVTDAKGRGVAGALVYAIGLPYAWVQSAPEVATGSDGWATITFRPTAALPRNSAVVFFVRARKPGDSLLAGVSTRRLVQVTVRF